VGVEIRLKEGRPYPLGATYNGHGVNLRCSRRMRKKSNSVFSKVYVKARAWRCRVRRRCLARLSAGRGPACSTAIASMDRTILDGHRFNRTSF